MERTKKNRKDKSFSIYISSDLEFNFHVFEPVDKPSQPLLAEIEISYKSQVVKTGQVPATRMNIKGLKLLIDNLKIEASAKRSFEMKEYILEINLLPCFRWIISYKNSLTRLELMITDEEGNNKTIAPTGKEFDMRNFLKTVQKYNSNVFEEGKSRYQSKKVSFMPNFRKKNLAIKMTELGFSRRCWNGLLAAEIETVADLIDYKKSNFLMFRNFGQKSIEEIEKKMLELGIVY